jgi:hypothetical protein
MANVLRKNPVTKRPQFAEQVAGHHKCPKNHAKKCPHFAEKPAGHRKHVGKNPVKKRPHVANSWQDVTNGSKIICDKLSKFCFKEGGHYVTEHLKEGGCHVTCDKASTSKGGWTKNTWMDRTGLRMSQGRIVTAGGSLGGRIVWVEMSRGRFVGGRIVKAPNNHQCLP